MKKLLIILLCFPMLFSSCQQNNPAPPCDGDCGTIVNTPYPNGAYILQQGPNGLIMINTHFICRIENDCSGERANFVLEGRDGDYNNGDYICNYQ
jgi:hypothetical protein